MVDSVVEELAKKRLGRTIKGKWRLDRLIGVGGMAAVYAATHRNGARVAIKMLHPTISASQQIRARFVREGYLANKVDHPGVVRILDDDVDEHDHSAFLVMDLVIGTTLAERAMDRLLDAGEVLDVADQVLQVLAAAHEKGIVHRDLKPDNLLVDRDGRIHVLDFGIARLLDETNFTATKTGTAFGTPGFMAPEQAMGKTAQISARTDLYALGATLFALVCGDFVHPAENPQELMVLVATQPARSLRELAPQMTPEVCDIIDKATKNQPNDRWESATAMLNAVRELKEKLGVAKVRVLPLNHPTNVTPAAPSVATPPALMRPTPSPEQAVTFPAPSAPIAPPSMPLAVESPISDHPPPAARKPKLLPVAIIGGGAVLVGVIGIVVATTRGGSAKNSASSPPDKPIATATATATATDTTPPPIPLPTVATAPSDDPTAAPSSTATTVSSTGGKVAPTFKVPTKGSLGPPWPAASASKKKIDVGY
ncbi:MAG: serine/threonine-protein kinase [Polyangiales bacterium]